MAKKQPASVHQTVTGNDNTQVVGSHNVINRITNFFAGDTEQQRALKNRRAMLELVRNTWVKGVLEKSLYNEVLIELGMEERPGAVEHPWDVQVQMPNRANRTLPVGTAMMDVFDEMGGAMLILGEPGSGKTTMLLELARDCIARAEEDETRPIPVVFNLSSWDGKLSIADWLVDELNAKYNVPKETAQGWVTNDELQLLLDGLDEVKLENQEACARSINDFRQQHGLAVPVAVCSRIADYEALKAKLNLSGAVYLQPLTPQQIDEYFERAGAELEGVHQVLQNDEMLRELIKQPLMLSILTLAYRGVSAETLESEKNIPLETRRKHLFDTYIQQMFERVARAKNEQYNTKQTKHWLPWLAQKMIEQGQPIFYLERLHLNWLQTRIQVSLCRCIVGFFTGLIFILSTAPLLISFFEWVVSGGELNSMGIRLLLGLELFIGSIGIVCGGFGKFLYPNEVLNLSWKKAKTGLLVSSAIWLIGILSIALLPKVFLGSIGLFVFYGLMAGIMFWVLTGVEIKELNVKTIPNQGIHQSVKNATYIGLFMGLFSGIFFTSIISWVFNPSHTIFSLFAQIINWGVMWGTFFWLQLGGWAFINHYTYRFLLVFSNQMPWDYVRFLDYSVERIFLRKIGGGYIFVHRSLMEHFAAMYPESGK